MKKIILFFIFIASSIGYSQFIGHSGVYYLGAANIPISAASYSNPDISGVVVRFRWNDIETSPGVFDWSFVDAEIAKATTYGKKVSLQPLGEPTWMVGLGVQQYYYIDNNTYHSTYGQVLSSSIVWDPIYVSRFQILLQEMATKYANNTTVSYINTIGGAFSRGLPTNVVTNTTTLTEAPFYTVFPYNADTFATLINSMTDYYMGLFPSTPLWCSVDYVPFETAASGKAKNYLATLYTNYGIANYPDRFGLWREDIAGCNPQTPINPGNQWYIIEQNSCRTGAQMLWNVQDGPARMNQCGLSPNTKQVVLDAAVQKGLSFGMRYLEIYGADINDATLSTNIQQANTNLIAQGAQCITLSLKDEKSLPNSVVFPNPTEEILNITFPINSIDNDTIQIYNSLGMMIKEIKIDESNISLDVSNFQNGVYFVKLKSKNSISKFIKK